ncbi:MAG: hypothetical protein U1E38_01890 [Rhodospirillales bacterium]
MLACLGSRMPVIQAEMARAALRVRRNRPMVIVDTGLPGDVDPLADRLDGVFLYTPDDLERWRARRPQDAAGCRGSRRGALSPTRSRAFPRERSERAAVPAPARLRSHFGGVRAQALADAGGDADMTRSLVNRLLHDPIRRLREIAGRCGEDETELNAWASFSPACSRASGDDDEEKP